jgi:HSP20 family molecular chaperone IbpA
MEEAMSNSTEMVKRDDATLSESTDRGSELQRAIPVVDVYENDDEILILADMPGVSAESLKIELDAGQLDIRGSQRAASGNDSAYVPFEYRRVFSLPETVDPDAVEADLSGGVLRITLGKSEAAKPRRIQVQTS